MAVVSGTHTLSCKAHEERTVSRDRRHPGPWIPPGESTLPSPNHLLGEGCGEMGEMGKMGEMGEGGERERERGVGKYQCLIHTQTHTQFYFAN